MHLRPALLSAAVLGVLRPPGRGTAADALAVVLAPTSRPVLLAGEGRLGARSARLAHQGGPGWGGGGAEGGEEGQGGSAFQRMMEQSQDRYHESHAGSAGDVDDGWGEPGEGGWDRLPVTPQPQDQYQQPQQPQDQYQQPQQPQAQYQQPQPRASAPPPPPPPRPPLPPGWASTVDPSSGRAYYYNQATGATSWTPPVAPPPPPPPPPPPAAAQGQAPPAQTQGAADEQQQLRVPTLEEQFQLNKAKNKDADSINNSADVYLAQLKRDSTVRKIAWLKGDYETANKPMADEGVERLKGWIAKNPHAKEATQKWVMVGTSEEEMLAARGRPGDDMTEEERRSFSGISYKQKMAERMRRKRAAGGK